MTLTPLVSIIIPTYNRAHVIAEALQSVLEQTYINWECIIVDDGSADNTLKILENWQCRDQRFRVFKRPETLLKGASSCRNFGYKQSKGDYIQWFDSDDVMHVKKLELKIASAIRYKAHVIVDKHASVMLEKINSNFSVDTFTSRNFYIDYILGSRPVITNDVMLKKDCIGDCRFDENLHKGEEFEFYSNVFNQQLTYCYMDVVLTRYKVSPDSLSISEKQAESLIYLAKKLEDKYKTNINIVARARRQGRKTYKNLISDYKVGLVWRNFSFFRTCYSKSSFGFFSYVVYNLLTKRGFDRMKPKQ